MNFVSVMKSNYAYQEKKWSRHHMLITEHKKLEAWRGSPTIKTFLTYELCFSNENKFIKLSKITDITPSTSTSLTWIHCNSIEYKAEAIN